MFVQKWLERDKVADESEYPFFRAVNASRKAISPNPNTPSPTMDETPLEVFFWDRKGKSTLAQLSKDIAISKESRKLFDINLHYIISPELFYRLCSQVWDRDEYDKDVQEGKAFRRSWDMFGKEFGKYRTLLNDMTLNAYEADPRIAYLVTKVLTDVLIEGGIPPERSLDKKQHSWLPKWGDDSPDKWSKSYDWSVMTRGEAEAVHALWKAQVQPKWGVLSKKIDRLLWESYQRFQEVAQNDKESGITDDLLYWQMHLGYPYESGSDTSNWIGWGFIDAVGSPDTKFHPSSRNDYKRKSEYEGEMRKAASLVKEYEEAPNTKGQSRAVSQPQVANGMDKSQG